MAIRLKQSTASQEVPLGHFLDSTDGVTAETGLTIANTDIKLWKAGATSLADKNSGGATHMAGGVYVATLDATDTDTLGPMVAFIHVAGALPVKVEFEVQAANVYDALIGGTDLLQVDVTDWKNATAPAMTGDAFARIGAAGAGLTAIIGADGDTLKSLSDQIDGLSTAAAPQLLVNTTIATLSSQTSFTLTAGSADDDAYAGAIAIITDQSTATQKAVASVSAYVGSTKTITLSADPGIFTMAVGDTIDLLAAIGSAPTAAAIRAEIDSNSTRLADIVADTNELQTDWVNGGRLDLILGARASQTSIPTATQNADALLNRDMSAVSDTNARSPLNALRFIRNKWSISGTTLTVTKEDDSTSAWTATVSTNASAEPVVGNDPA